MIFVDTSFWVALRLTRDAHHEQVETEALRWLRSHPEREYSFVDATSFVLAPTPGITAALAFDGDFATAGLTGLRAP